MKNEKIKKIKKIKKGKMKNIKWRLADFGAILWNDINGIIHNRFM